jgi:hypothetical protein
MPTWTPQEQRFAAALGALAQASERAESCHFGGLYFGDADQLGAAETLRLVRARFLDDWVQARNEGDRAKLADIATATAAQLARRNAGAQIWSPSVIADQLAETDAAVTALSIDIRQQWCHTFEDAQQAAEAAFAKRHGRAPAVGALTRAQADADMAEVFAGMGVSSVDADARCFNGALVKQFSAFVAEWNHFKDAHKSWTDNMWGNTGDQVIDYRRRVLAWRKKFTEAGGKLNSPDPVIPDTTFGLGIPWSTLTVVAALVAAALIVPPVLGAITRR